MKVETEKKALVEALAMVHRAAGRRPEMPVLGNVLLRTVDGKLHLVCCDLNAQLATRVSVNTSVGDSEVTVPAKRLFDFVRSLPGESVKLESDDDGWLTVASGRAKVRLATIPACDFPEMRKSDFDSATLPASVLRTLADRALYAASVDDGRPHLAGVKLEIDDSTARAIATDGHRLAMAALPVEAGFALDVLLPRDAVVHLLRLLDGAETVDIALDGNQIGFDVGDTSMIAKLIDARFPPYEKVIPSKPGNPMIVYRQTLIDAVKRALLVSSKGNFGAVIVEAHGSELTVSSESPEVGSATEALFADFDGNAKFGVNGAYLVDALNSMESDSVKFHLHGEHDAVKITPMSDDEQVAVVMPMRL